MPGFHTHLQCSAKCTTKFKILQNAALMEVIVIEASTVPGKTPSTVLFQQALAGRHLRNLEYS